MFEIQFSLKTGFWIFHVWNSIFTKNWILNFYWISNDKSNTKFNVSHNLGLKKNLIRLHTMQLAVGIIVNAPQFPQKKYFDYI
jgi:hypothetical protein